MGFVASDRISTLPLITGRGASPTGANRHFNPIPPGYVGFAHPVRSVGCVSETTRRLL
jgi:hypothetical protein